MRTVHLFQSKFTHSLHQGPQYSASHCIFLDFFNAFVRPISLSIINSFFSLIYNCFSGSARQDRQREGHIQFDRPHLQARLHIPSQPLQDCRQPGHQVTHLDLASLNPMSGNKANMQMSSSARCI